jgi:hypothetical protein
MAPLMLDEQRFSEVWTYRALDANFIALPASEPASRQCLGAYQSL